LPAIGFPVPGTIVYRVGGPLPALSTHATVYRADATTTSARVGRLAGALGLPGAVQENASGWTVQGSDRSLQVQRTGGLPWTVSSTGGGSVSSGCAIASPGSTGGAGLTPPAPPASPPPTCPTTTTVPGLPAKGDAEARASDVLTRAGFDLTAATASSSGGIDSWYVSFTPTIAGLPVLGGQWSVTVGANGAILSGSGRLADPVAVGDYPLVGVTTGVQRLHQGGNWIVYSGPVPMLGGFPLRGSAGSATDSAASGTAAGGTAGAVGGTTAAVPPGDTATPSAPPESSPGGGPAVPPPTSPCGPDQPCAPVPTTTTTVSVPPAVMTITGVHLAEAWAWPPDPSSPDAWLVPVYVFELTGATAYPFLGSDIPVLAVTDRYVAAPPSTTVPTGGTKPGTAPAPNTVVTSPAPNPTSKE
jgi:hypothetical protein